MAAFLYQYLVGGILFVAAFVLAWRSGDYSFKNRDDRFTALFLGAIFLCYLFGHLIWVSAALGGG